MRESVIYQELQAEAREEVRQELLEILREETRRELVPLARQEGEQIGEQRGRRQGQQQEAINLIVRQLSRRLRQSVSEEVQDRLAEFGVEPLEELGEALLDFTSLTDLEAWLQAYRQQQQARIERIVPQLSRQLGQEMDEEESDRLILLSVEQLDELESALGNFTSLGDLEAWFQGHRY